MAEPFERIVLFKLRAAHADATARERLARRLVSALVGARATVALPADAAAEKSWDLSLVVRFATLDEASAFDPTETLARAAGLDAAEVVEVVKGWTFRQV